MEKNLSLLSEMKFYHFLAFEHIEIYYNYISKDELQKAFYII